MTENIADVAKVNDSVLHHFRNKTEMAAYFEPFYGAAKPVNKTRREEPSLQVQDLGELTTDRPGARFFVDLVYVDKYLQKVVTCKANDRTADESYVSSIEWLRTFRAIRRPVCGDGETFWKFHTFVPVPDDWMRCWMPWRS
jgi:hypothetical protein